MKRGYLWTSSNAEVATVTRRTGIVRSKAVGHTTITCEWDGLVSKKREVTVKGPRKRTKKRGGKKK